MSVILDAHCHVASERYTPRSFIEGVVATIATALPSGHDPKLRNTLLTMYLQGMQDHSCDDFVRSMDEAGVEAAVLLLPDFTFALRDAELTIEEMIKEHASIVERHRGRLIYLCGVDPRWGMDAVDLFESAVNRYGARGLKLYPPCGYRPDDERLFPFYEICRQHGLPVVIHTGPTSSALRFDFAHPDHVEGAAIAFPSVRFVLAHGGVNHIEASCLLAAYRPNIFVDFSGFTGSVQAGGGVAAGTQLFERRLNHKLLFGTDWPVGGLQQRYVDLVDDVVGPSGMLRNAAPVHRSAILAATARQVFGFPRPRECERREASGQP